MSETIMYAIAATCAVAAGVLVADEQMEQEARER